MGYLIGEIWLWLLIAFVIGLIIGWLIWGRGRAAMQSRITELERQLANAKAQCDSCEAEKAELVARADAAEAARADLERQAADAKAAAESSTAEVARLSSRVVELEKERDAAGVRAASAEKRAAAAAASGQAEQASMRARIAELETELAAEKAKASTASSPAAAATEAPVRSAGSAADTASVAGASGDDTVSLTDAEADIGGAQSAGDSGGDDGSDIAVTAADRPDSLAAPQGAKDDLKLISGVGPKLEGVLNELGVFHFWQIAKWTDREVAWVDDYLSFKGRINRDKWIDQSKVLAEGGETEFSKRNK